ncbi:hypothetical protein PSDI105340_18045 [Pseudoalteromonas distincta]
MSMDEKNSKIGRATEIEDKEQAMLWLSKNPNYKPLLDSIIDFLHLHYRGSNKGWVNDGNAKFKFGPSNKNGRVSIDPRPSKNGVNVRFGVNALDIPDYFYSEDLSQLLRPENCFNKTQSYYDILFYLKEDNLQQFEALKSFIKAGTCDGFIHDEENHALYNEIQSEVRNEGPATYIRRAISEKVCERKEQFMEDNFVQWYKLKNPELVIKRQYHDLSFKRDIVIVDGSKKITAELKYKRTATEEIEAAIGQLLRYGYYPDVEPSDEFWIVGSKKPTKEDVAWFHKLKENLWFKLKYYYLNEDQKSFIEVF